MNPKVNSLIKSLPFSPYLGISLGINIAVISGVILLLPILPPQVPLFYGAPVSERQLTSSFGLIIPGAVSITISLVNILLAIFIKDTFSKKALILTSILVSVFSTITTIKIIFLVGNF